MKMNTIFAIFVSLALLGLPGLSSAGITTFSATDDGVYPGPWLNSATAQANFMAAAGGFGPLNTITFENLPTGFYTPFSPAPGVTVMMNASNYGDGISGISDTTFGQLYGFNTTPSGSKWFGFPGSSYTSGSATFIFAVPTYSFGMYLTGLQTFYTTSLTESFNDGAPQTLTLPVTVNGGAEYFGFTDNAPFSTITITDNGNDGYYDYWGIDDVTYNAVPVPPSVWLFGSGVLGLLGWRRFRKA